MCLLSTVSWERCVSRSASRTAIRPSPSLPVTHAVTLSLMHAQSEVQSADFTE